MHSQHSGLNTQQHHQASQLQEQDVHVCGAGATEEMHTGAGGQGGCVCKHHYSEGHILCAWLFYSGGCDQHNSYGLNANAVLQYNYNGCLPDGMAT